MCSKYDFQIGDNGATVGIVVRPIKRGEEIMVKLFDRDLLQHIGIAQIVSVVDQHLECFSQIESSAEIRK